MSAALEPHPPRQSPIDEHFELTSDADDLAVDESLVQRIEQYNLEVVDGNEEVTDTPSTTEEAVSNSFKEALLGDEDCNTFLKCKESRKIPFRNTDFPLEETGCYVSDSGEVRTVYRIGMI